ncbi:hypothetical protein [Rhizobium nepotum]|uniref:Uncharacterized protein n=1 Tax=Rhizobium nepotum 39/7 TaxID=1368418 RepID=A0ABR5CX60_9HYPH|nr:hypothetical protein [Rhizobium nepotum]KJF69416.1 hypothetical protein RS75_02295 [Rhizobium nepotum 39/7]
MFDFEISAKISGAVGYTLVALFFAFETLLEQKRSGKAVTFAGLFGFVLCILWPAAIILVLIWVLYSYLARTGFSNWCRSIIFRWF